MLMRSYQISQGHKELPTFADKSCQPFFLCESGNPGSVDCPQGCITGDNKKTKNVYQTVICDHVRLSDHCGSLLEHGWWVEYDPGEGQHSVVQILHPWKRPEGSSLSRSSTHLHPSAEKRHGVVDGEAAQQSAATEEGELVRHECEMSMDAPASCCVSVKPAGIGNRFPMVFGH